MRPPSVGLPVAMRPILTDPDRQRDLLQEMHLELLVSLRSFDGRCSLRNLGSIVLRTMLALPTLCEIAA